MGRSLTQASKAALRRRPSSFGTCFMQPVPELTL
jgi:hypothetical protein